MRAKRKQASGFRKGDHIVKGLDQFRPGKKKAQGDAVRKNKLLPFAYVKLNPKITKEKHKGKAMQSLARVVQKGSKKGVVRGGKARATEVKLKARSQQKRKRRDKGKSQPSTKNSR